VAALVLALTYRRFRFAHAGVGGRPARARRVVAEGAPSRARPVEVPRVAGSFGVATTARQTLAVARRALAEVTSSRWFAAVLVALAGITMLVGWNVGDTVFDTSTWPVTMLVAGTVLSRRVAPIVYVLVALHAGELVWKDRDARVDEIADAAPVGEGAQLLGRLLALLAIIVMFLAALMVGGILIQALQGYRRFEIGLYLRTLVGLDLAGYAIFAVLAMTVQVLVNHKYLGHVVLLLAFLATMTLRMLGVVRHHLLLYGTTPGWTYSDMNGFGPFLEPFAWFTLYWAAWALLLAVVAVLFWVRGREGGARREPEQARGERHREAVGEQPARRVARLALGLQHPADALDMRIPPMQRRHQLGALRTQLQRRRRLGHQRRRQPDQQRVERLRHAPLSRDTGRDDAERAMGLQPGPLAAVEAARHRHRVPEVDIEDVMIILGRFEVPRGRRRRQHIEERRGHASNVHCRSAPCRARLAQRRRSHC
jgi:hypothetical protein